MPSVLLGWICQRPYSGSSVCVALALPRASQCYLCSLSGVFPFGGKPSAVTFLMEFLQENGLVFLQYIKKQDTYINFSGKVCVIN